MKLTSNSFSDGKPISPEFAFADIDPKSHFTFSRNRNPHLQWSDVPAQTQSFVLICHDPDVPSRGDDVNKEDREVPESLQRVDFFHWVLLDIPSRTREIAAGSQSNGVTPHGKPGPSAPSGWRHGLNDYTKWFSGNPEMKGNYYGYDGPAPPWNDALLHHYVFTLYAIDVPRLEIAGDITGQSVREALTQHGLADAALTGTYSLNPKVREDL